MKRHLVYCLGTALLLLQPCAGAPFQFEQTGSLIARRYSHSATLLQNGKVLVAGGFGDAGVTNGSELYDPANGSWTRTGSLITARYAHTATLLQNGKVLIAAGYNGTSLKSA